MEVLVVLCPSSLAHWLVGFWPGDSLCFLFVFFVSGFLACLFFCFVFVFFLFFFGLFFCFCFLFCFFLKSFI